MDRGVDTRRRICLNLEEMGFEIEASHHECAAGQHEIDFKYADALTAADNIMTFKLTVKTIAQQDGLHATFMPKPIYGIAGSGKRGEKTVEGGLLLYCRAADSYQGYDGHRQSPDQLL